MLRHFNQQFVVKGAGKGPSFAWHQDSAYVGFDHPPYLTVWFAMDNTTEDNGGEYLIPRDLGKNSGIDPHEWQDKTNELNGCFGEDVSIPMIYTAGSIVAFSSRTLHPSGPNTTYMLRRAMIAQYSTKPIQDPNTWKIKRYPKPVVA